MSGSKRIFLLALLALVASTTASEAVTPWGPPTGQSAGVASLKPLRNFKRDFLEKYTFYAELEGGGSFYFSVANANMLFQGKKLEVKARVTPTKGAKAHTSKATFKADEWSSGKGLDIRMGEYAITGTAGKIVLAYEGQAGPFTFTFQPTVPLWRPGRGQVTFGSKGDYLDYTIIPDARVTGRLQGEKGWVDLKGKGYGTHSHSSLAPHEVAKRWLTFRTTKGDAVIWLKEFIVTEKYGRGDIPFFMLAQSGQVTMETERLKLTPANFQVDTLSKEKYQVPRRITAEAIMGDQMAQIEISLTAPRTRNDPLASLSSVERMVVERFAKPMSYSFFAKYEGTWKKGEETRPIRGEGVVEVDYLNK